MVREETSTAGQRLSKHVHAVTNMQVTIEGLLGNGVFCWVRPDATLRGFQVGSNTSIVALRVVGGEEKATQFVGV
jgi:hypothetical protein